MGALAIASFNFFERLFGNEARREDLERRPAERAHRIAEQEYQIGELRRENIRLKADAAWARAFAERTGGTVPTNTALGPRQSGGYETDVSWTKREQDAQAS